MQIWIPILTAVVAGLFSYIASNLRISKEIELAEKRLRHDYQFEFAAEAVMRKLLSVEQWDLRSFGEIERRLPGMEENEVRKMLIRSGAICFKGKGSKEMWGLIERNEHRLNEE